MVMRNLSAVILAAGFSSRMGEFKPLLPLGPNAVVDQVIGIFREAGVEDILVVIGHNIDAMRSHLQAAGVTLVENPDFETGMFSSVKAGVSRLNTASQGFFMLPVDIPLVRAGTIRRLGQALTETNADVVYPCFQGRRGHPPLIRRNIVAEIRQAGPDFTLRDILSRCTAEFLETPDRNILFDIDTMDDYRELQRRWTQKDIPTKEECDVFFKSYGPINMEVRNHCEAVALVACRIGRALNNVGENLDMDLIHSAALLHDIAKASPDHAAIAGNLLTEMGFRRVGDIVAGHMDLDVPEDAPISEAEVLYLADKCVRGVSVETIENRYQEAMLQYGRNQDVRQHIEDRRRRAEKSKDRLEQKLNQSLYDVIFQKTGDTSG